MARRAAEENAHCNYIDLVTADKVENAYALRPLSSGAHLPEKGLERPANIE